ncbi:MAG: MucR family transcriptional regulator [Rhodospirillaceae bacterium]
MMSDALIPELTAKIVAAFVSRNNVTVNDLPGVITIVQQALSGLINPPAAVEPVADLKPAVPIKKSVTADHIICLEDGKKLKMLKRHLMSTYGMTPEEYRSKWGLAADYPMVAPNYAKARSDLALQLGLGRRKAD